MRICALICVAALAIAGCSDSSPAPASRTPSKAPPLAGEPQNESRSARLAIDHGQALNASTPAAGESLNLDYLPDDAFAVLVVNSRRLFQSRALAPFATDKLWDGPIAQWNLDPRQIEYLLLFTTPPVEGEPLGTPYSPGAVMRFVAPIDGQALVATRGATQEIIIAGKKCFTQPGKPTTAFYLPDDRTIVFAAEKQLTKMLSPTHVKNPLSARLTGTDRNFDVRLLVNVEPLQPALPAISEAARAQLPQSAWPFVDGLRDVDSMTATCNLSGDVFLTLSIEARDRDAAGRLHKLAEEARPQTRSAHAAVRRLAADTLDARIGPSLLEMIDELPGLTAMSLEPARLKIEVAKPPQLDRLGDRFQAELERERAPL